MTPNFGILVMAAGQSSRFGSDKLLAKMSDGQPVIAHSLAPLLTMAKRYDLKLCVVTRADNHALNDYLTAHEIPFTSCSEAHLGMGHSIAHGVKSNSLWQGWMIALADMPSLTNNIVEVLITHIIQHPDLVVRPCYVEEDKNIPSHPVYFPQDYKLKLTQLVGDDGAKSIIKQQTLLEVAEMSHLMDIDTPEALAKITL